MSTILKHHQSGNLSQTPEYIFRFTLTLISLLGTLISTNVNSCVSVDVSGRALTEHRLSGGEARALHQALLVEQEQVGTAGYDGAAGAPRAHLAAPACAT